MVKLCEFSPLVSNGLCCIVLQEMALENVTGFRLLLTILCSPIRFEFVPTMIGLVLLISLLPDLLNPIVLIVVKSLPMSKCDYVQIVFGIYLKNDALFFCAHFRSRSGFYIEINDTVVFSFNCHLINLI